MSSVAGAEAGAFIADAREAVLRRPAFWQQLRDARVFMSGATGFLGSWILALAAAANREYGIDLSVTIGGRNEARLARSRAMFGDALALDARWMDVAAGVRGVGGFTHVLHAAAVVNRASSAADPDRTRREVVDGTRNMLDIARETDARFLFLSSGAVYGTIPAGTDCVEETASPGTLSGPWAAYAEAKRAAEVLCHESDVRHAIIARIFSCLGYGMPLAQYAVGNFITDALEGRAIRVRQPRTVRTYLYAADAAEWLWVMAADTRATGAYNVGGDEPICMERLASQVAACMSPAVDVLADVPSGVVDAAIGAGDRYVPCVTRAGRELGVTVSTPLTEAVRRTVAGVALYSSGRERT